MGVMSFEHSRCPVTMPAISVISESTVTWVPPSEKLGAVMGEQYKQ